MANGRKIEDELEARRCLNEADRSGMQLRDWAHSKGIDARSLNIWRVILGRKGSAVARRPRRSRPAAVARVGLVELVPISRSSVAPPSTTASSARYVLEFGSARIEFGDDFSPATLGRVLEVLRAC